jgi:predicted kinase
MNKPIFIMMVGLVGSGKSTYAKQLSDDINAIICNSDAIRGELFGNENIQNQNEEVFRVLHKRIKNNLKNGKNTIYDATNIKSRRRRAFLSELKNIPCIKKCIIMATPFHMCYKQNESRSRIVPYEVIDRMYKNWNTPYWFEGWDDIRIVFPQNYKIVDTVENWIDKHMEFNQDNPHHVYTLGQHCKLVGEELKDNSLLYYAGSLHDCGKPFVKSFVNSKREITDIAHYYQHHCTGSYDSLFFDYPQSVNRLDVSIIINLHMQPYFWEKDKEYGDKTKHKYQKLLGDKLYNNVMRLHKADKEMH